MRWSDERYVRVYTRDDGEWIALGWEAQAVFLLALRKADRAGIIKTGRSKARGLALMTGMPEDVVARALPMLLDGSGPPMVETAEGLVIRNYIEAQETPQSDACRQREKRARDRDRAVTNCDTCTTERDETVTNGHEPSRTVTKCHSDPIRSVPIRTEEEDCTEVGGTLPLVPPEPPLLTFPCAKGQTWHLTESIRAELAEAYPNVDVLACARKALEWLRANPRKLKTVGRMRGWIGTTWCGRDQDRGGSRPDPRPAQPRQPTYNQLG